MKARTSLAACLLVPALLTGCADVERDDEAAGGSAQAAPGGEGDDRPDDVSEWSSEQLADLYNTAFSNLAVARSVVLEGEVERDGTSQSVHMELEPERNRCTLSSVAGKARHPCGRADRPAGWPDGGLEARQRRLLPRRR